MNILVTGAAGFVGKNLCAALKCIADGKDKSHSIDPDITVFEYDIDTDKELLDGYCQKADFVFNLAGVNRPLDEKEFMLGNFGFASTLLDTLKKHNNTCPVMLSSSIKASESSPYGLSKKAGEDLFFNYSKETGARVLVYRFPNVFGKWCKPNYNSAVATFCHNIANGLDITVNDRNILLTLVYIDDLVNELISALDGNETKDGKFCAVKTTHQATLGQITDLLYSFKESRNSLYVPNTQDGFTNKLYATYLSYLPKDGFAYPLCKHSDPRGSFTEIIRTKERGQFSVNVSNPGITKGNHWHNTKNEKFLVVSGEGVIRFRKIGESDVHEYKVNGDEPVVVDIPIGYTHSIENVGQSELVTFMWANECFDPDKPDTFFEPVILE